MIVLVAGAHGRLGSRILALLLDRGHRVRALVRTQRQAAALRDARPRAGYPLTGAPAAAAASVAEKIVRHADRPVLVLRRA